MSAKANFIIANNVTLSGRRLLQLFRAPRRKRSYELRCDLFALTGMSRSVVDGDLLGRGLVREVKHRDHTRSYVLTQRGRSAAQALEAKIGK